MEFTGCTTENTNAPPGSSTRATSATTPGMSSTFIRTIEATARSAAPSSTGIAAASPSSTSIAGSPPRAAAASAGDDSTPRTLCPRACSTRASRPSPHPTSSVSRPGGGSRSRSHGSPIRQKPWSSSGERAQRIQSPAFASHAARRLMGAMVPRGSVPAYGEAPRSRRRGARLRAGGHPRHLQALRPPRRARAAAVLPRRRDHRLHQAVLQLPRQLGGVRGAGRDRGRHLRARASTPRRASRRTTSSTCRCWPTRA